MKKVVFMGGKEVGYNCFLFLLENTAKLNIEIIALFENDSKLNSEQFDCRKLAKEHGIPVYSNPDRLLQIEHIDVIISVQYHLILTKVMIDTAKELAINLHMAPVPEYRGCNQFSFAIIDEAKEFGTTLHQLNTEIDGGDVIAERRFPIGEECFVSELYASTVRASISLFKDEMAKILSGDYTLTPQKELAKTRKSAYYGRKDIEKLKVIHHHWPDEKKKRYFRASYFPPFTPAVLVEGDKRVLTNMDWYKTLI